jgi:hypothetical protein
MGLCAILILGWQNSGRGMYGCVGSGSGGGGDGGWKGGFGGNLGGVLRVWKGFGG